jgi:hypothetical protein
MRANRRLNNIGMYDNYKYLVNWYIKSIYLAPPLSIYVAGPRTTTAKRDSCSVCGLVRFDVSTINLVNLYIKQRTGTHVWVTNLMAVYIYTFDGGSDGLESNHTQAQTSTILDLLTHCKPPINLTNRYKLLPPHPRVYRVYWLDSYANYAQAPFEYVNVLCACADIYCSSSAINHFHVHMLVIRDRWRHFYRQQRHPYCRSHAVLCSPILDKFVLRTSRTVTYLPIANLTKKYVYLWQPQTFWFKSVTLSAHYWPKKM